MHENHVVDIPAVKFHTKDAFEVMIKRVQVKVGENLTAQVPDR